MNAGPVPLRTLSPWPDPTGYTDGVTIAASNSAGATWRLQLHAMEAGRHEPAWPVATTQLTPLDAPLALRAGDASRTVLRLQVAAPVTGEALDLESATRLVRLERHTEGAAELIARPLLGPMLLPTADQHWLAWLLAGRAEVRLGDDRWELPTDRLAWLPAAPGQRLRVEGGGELLLVRVPASPAP